MRNKLIDTAIEETVDQSPYPSDFKNVFKQYIKNVFDGNAAEGDLKRVLRLLTITEEDNEL